MSTDVAFLFLGETLLIPHLFPVLEAVAARAPGMRIDAWVATSMHEGLLRGWLGTDSGVRIRRAPGFRDLGAWEAGRNPPLPAKLPLLARLAPRLATTRVVVSAEQTSLWIPTILPTRARFVNMLHGAGSMMNRDDRRRKAAALTIVAAERERRALAAHGVDPARIAVVGYAKAGFRQRTHAALGFAGARPGILYAPHWQRHRSSWWDWGEAAVRRILAADRYDLIFAPHQRLVEKAPEVRAFATTLADRPDVHVDLDSFAMVDGSYTAAADLYLGDTSSQVVEFLMRPRPCVFLDPRATAWQGNASYDMWQAGEVVTALDALLPALDRAAARHGGYLAAQRAFAAESLGDTGGAAPGRAADAILTLAAGA
ncbi:hypothetical protein LPN01_13915 [Sphingomonas sp. A2-49]|uniref:hypothetical protein n=1 Tax=Sphingomonas sp. A2-49 TaxID=1391375 RepID=UPI0021CDF6B2|nr:hypothetical protein [Sphingomonas sp. A2-49]MCU6455177.1 hypothetical protein [Sphingomonas sp. A2-49]